MKLIEKYIEELPKDSIDPHDQKFWTDLSAEINKKGPEPFEFLKVCTSTLIVDITSS